jgi:chitinase
VVVTSADGSATAGGDYVAVSRTIRFLTGVSTRSFPVTLLDDAVYEGDETLTLSLAPAPGSTSAVQIGTPSTATLTIAEDDPPPRLAISNASGDEGTTLSFTVTLTGSTTVAASVDFEAQEGTADAGADFAEASGTISSPPATPPRRSRSMPSTTSTSIRTRSSTSCSRTPRTP